MRMNKSGTKNWDFSLYTSAPLWLREHNFPFSPKTGDYLFQAGAKIPKMSLQKKAGQKWAEQSRAELSI